MKFTYKPDDKSLLFQFSVDESKHIAKDNFLRFDKSKIRELAATFIEIGTELGRRVGEIDQEHKLKMRDGKPYEAKLGSKAVDTK